MASYVAAAIVLAGLLLWFAIAVLALVAVERALVWLCRRVAGRLRRSVPAPAEEAPDA
jgi:hypothetical protein